MMRPVLFSLCLLLPISVLAFPLSDSHPNSPEFRKRFLGSYGFHGELEPKLTKEDKPLFDAALPHLENNPREAIRIVEGRIDGKSNAAFDFLLGNLYYQIEDFERAERWLGSALQKFPGFRRAWRTLALSRVRQDKLEEAVPALLKVIELGGGDAQSYGLLAYARLQAGHWLSAMRAYELALVFSPESQDFRRGLASCYLMLDKPREAVALFEELLTEQPRNREYWIGQANAFLTLSRFEDAQANLEMVESLGEGDASSRLLLAELSINNGLDTRAIKHLLHVLEAKEPPLGRVVRLYSRYVERGRWGEAEALLKALEKHALKTLAQDDREIFDYAAIRTRFALGEPERALDSIDALLERQPLDGRALLLKADYQQAQGQYAEALFTFERARQTDQAYEAQLGLGRLYIKMGEPRKALGPLREALLLRPSDALEDYVRQLEGVR